MHADRGAAARDASAFADLALQGWRLAIDKVCGAGPELSVVLDEVGD